MNFKRLLLIGLILVAVAASLSVVSADSSVKVDGIDFNIPDGFSENKTLEQNGVNTTYNNQTPVQVFMKGFTNDNGAIVIIVMEFNSPDDVKKVQDDLKQEINTTKTINGKEGVYEKDESGSATFTYGQDKCLIMVVSTDDSLLESIITK